MVERDAVAAEVREDVDVLETGRWYIAEGSYDGRETAAQGESEREAIDKLIQKFYSRARKDEQRERDREFRKERSEWRRERAERETERVREQADQEMG